MTKIVRLVVFVMVVSGFATRVFSQESLNTSLPPVIAELNSQDVAKRADWENAQQSAADQLAGILNLREISSDEVEYICELISSEKPRESMLGAYIAEVFVANLIPDKPCILRRSQVKFREVFIEKLLGSEDFLHRYYCNLVFLGPSGIDYLGEGSIRPHLPTVAGSFYAEMRGVAFSIAFDDADNMTKDVELLHLKYKIIMFRHMFSLGNARKHIEKLNYLSCVDYVESYHWLISVYLPMIVFDQERMVWEFSPLKSISFWCGYVNGFLNGHTQRWSSPITRVLRLLESVPYFPLGPNCLGGRKSLPHSNWNALDDPSETLRLEPMYDRLIPTPSLWGKE